MAKSLRGIIGAQDIHLDVRVTCKRSILEMLSQLSAQRFGLSAPDILQKLLDREQLGSTGVGGGIALPHARGSVTGVHGIFLRLCEPVSFDAIDGGKVDLVFLLLAPDLDNANHLKALSRVARTLKTPGVLHILRGATTPEAAYSAFTCEGNAEAA
ncbi:MAG: PTS sugar transporter subunit IIA [Pseudomonadota bacterium]